MNQRRILLAVLLYTLLLMPFPVQGQVEDVISLVVQAGYDSYFREEYWLPLQIQVRNEGSNISGRLVVRPETSGRAVSNTYSTPIELPTGSEKTAFLYIQARSFPSTIVVELLDNEDTRLAERLVNLSGIQPHDTLHVVVSNPDASSIPLNALVGAGWSATEARWEASQLPPDAQALLAINTLILYDLNSDSLSVGQLEALQRYVAAGGHLIVIGGPSWAETSSALTAWLPFTPENSQNVDEISGLATFIGADPAALQSRVFLTTGSVQDGAEVLATTADGLPLIVRGVFGSGTIDYLTVDPTLEPLRSWSALPDLWFSLVTSLEPRPGWTRGFLDTQETARAIAILPGIDLLPPVLSMVAFIAAYILIIGPLNYVVLSRINRREWAWFTIPLAIIAFTTMAWTVGFNLRGTEVIVSRLNIVQGYAGSDTARVDQLLGILSPRRDLYQMEIPADRFLRVLPGLSQNNFLQQNISQSTSQIVQSERFYAQDIGIDGGIFANFSLLGFTPTPAIGGSITLSYDAETGAQSVRGLVRNDSDITLHDAVIVTRNRYYALQEPLEAGALLNFQTNNLLPIRENLDTINPLASRLEAVYGLDLGNQFRNSSATYNSLETNRVLMGDVLSIRPVTQAPDPDASDEENRRRALIRSFMRDQYATQNIGNSAYIIGWSNDPLPQDISIEGVTFRAVDTSLYIMELDVTVETAPSTTTVLIEPNQFSWAVRGRDLAEGGVEDVTIINPGWIEVRYTPIRGALLSSVSELTIQLDRSSSYGRDVALALWNWQTQEWDTFDNRSLERYIISDPTPYLGPRNIVDLRLALDRTVGGTAASARIRGISITQSGRF